MTDLEILQILVRAKELGITQDDVALFKAHSSDTVSRETYVPDLKAQEIVVPGSPFDDLSEDEILYWHSPFYDEIQTKKEAQKQKLAEEHMNNG